MRRSVLVAVVFLSLALAGSAAAASAHSKRQECRTGYTARAVTKREVRHGRSVKVRSVRCVAKRHKPKSSSTSKPPTTTTPVPSPTPTTTTTPVAAPAPTPVAAPAPAAPTIHYAASVDPSFVQDPDNPLAVTYSYSADATQTVDDVSTDLAATASLPAGVLNFYSGGLLACSMNVGGATSGGACEIDYPSVGTYEVTTQYLPDGTAGVTETESETIDPYPSTTTIGPITYDSQSYTSVGPPPLYLTFIHQWATFAIDSSDPDNASYTLTINDQTTGQTLTCGPLSGTSPVSTGVEFVTAVNDPETAPLSVDCGGSASLPVGSADVLTLSASLIGSDGYLPSSSGTYPLWPVPSD